MTIPELNVVEKQYMVDVWIGNQHDYMEDFLESAIAFEVINIGHSKLPLRSIIHETGKWKVVKK